MIAGPAVLPPAAARHAAGARSGRAVAGGVRGGRNGPDHLHARLSVGASSTTSSRSPRSPSPRASWTPARWPGRSTGAGTTPCTTYARASPCCASPRTPVTCPRTSTTLTALAKAQTDRRRRNAEHRAHRGAGRVPAARLRGGARGGPGQRRAHGRSRRHGRQLITIQVVTFGLALLALVVFGRALLRRGLKPLSDMAHTAHGIASHDLTESASRCPPARRRPRRRPRGRGAAHGVQHDAGAHRRLPRRARGGRAAAAAFRRRRLARAAHPADVSTRLRRPFPVRGRQRARGA